MNFKSDETWSESFRRGRDGEKARNVQFTLYEACSACWIERTGGTRAGGGSPVSWRPRLLGPAVADALPGLTGPQERGGKGGSREARAGAVVGTEVHGLPVCFMLEDELEGTQSIFPWTL